MTDEEILEIGNRIEKAAERSYKALRPGLEYPKGDWIGGGALMDEPGVVSRREVDGRLCVEFLLHTKEANACYRWFQDEEPPLTPEEIGLVMAGTLIGWENRQRMDSGKALDALRKEGVMSREDAQRALDGAGMKGDATENGR